MPFGKLYGYLPNSRTVGLLAIAKENKLDIEFVETEPPKVSNDYRKLNKQGRIPTFEGADGFILTEVIAIAVYLTSQNEKTTLLGKTKQDYASILRWLSFGNSELIPCLGGWFRPLLGLDPYNKKSVDESQKSANEAFKVLEDHLMINTYLVGERLTLADVMVASFTNRAFSMVLDKKWRDEHPSVTRWFDTIVAQPIFKAVMPEVKRCQEAVKYQPPAKPKQEKPKQEKKEKAKAQAADEEEEDEPKEAPKPKHPLEALGKASMPIDEWKRKYKNEETREVALPWFWKNINFEDYSIWQLDFKYNDELTMTFMSNNQIGGFFNRLEASRKFLMGCASVFGKTNDSVIKGAFLVRGQEAIPAFDVAPDWESYEFTKLDPHKAEDRKLVESMFAWDEPVVANGKTYEWADGKVFV